jgi:hypothetical protein
MDRTAGSSVPSSRRFRRSTIINNTIEFRLHSGDPAAFAAILRYRTADDDGQERGHVLVVSKLDGGEACRIAYIDARANTDANALARRTADSMAGSFDCRRDQPKTIGATGISRLASAADFESDLEAPLSLLVCASDLSQSRVTFRPTH